MPFKSEKQRKWMWANDPEMAKKWEKEEKMKKETKVRQLIKKMVREIMNEDFGGAFPKEKRDSFNKMRQKQSEVLGYKQNLKEVGAGAQYKKFYKDIERQQQGLSKSVEKFKKYLEKQGLKSEATKLYDNYLIDSYGWMRKWLKKFIGVLM